MLGRSVGITAAFAVGASALILPPGVAPASSENTPELSTNVANPKERVITIPCSECAFPAKQETVEDVAEGEELMWIQGGANNLLLNFTITEDGSQLQLNDVPVYPRHLGVDMLQSVYVKQVPAHAGLVDIKAGDARSTDLEVTAYGLFEGDRKPISANNDALIPVKLEIYGLEGQTINTVDRVVVDLLHTGDGERLIMRVDTLPNEKPHLPPFFGQDGPEDLDLLPPPPPPESFRGPPHHGPHAFRPKECSMLPAPLCRLRAMLDAKIDAAMGPHHGPPHGFRKGGCHGRKGGPKQMPGHIKPHFLRPGHEEDGVQPHHGRPHHGRPHRMHHGGPHPHHHHHGHRLFGLHFFHAFAKGIVAVLVPVMAGITVGMVVSLLGLVVGRFVGYLWITFARGGRRGSVSNSAHREIVLEEGEDKAMMTETEAEPLPRYEAAPAYDDVVEEKEAR